MQSTRDYTKLTSDGSPAWFYACMWSALYLPVAYFIYTGYQFGPYLVIAFLIFSNLYIEGANARQNRRFAVELSFLKADYHELKQQYETTTNDLRDELREIKEWMDDDTSARFNRKSIHDD